MVATEKDQHLLKDLDIPQDAAGAQEEGGSSASQPAKLAPYKGVKYLGCTVDFKNTFGNFCQNSLRIRSEVVAALYDIQGESSYVLNRLLFRSQYHTPHDLNNLKEVTILNPTLSNTNTSHRAVKPNSFLNAETEEIKKWDYLVQKYVPNVRSHVYKHLNSVTGEKWFNLYETDPARYSVSRLRGFLEEIDLRLQDTLHTLGIRSLNYFEKLLNLYAPERVNIKSLNNVETISKRGDGAKTTLFKIDVILILEKKNPVIDESMSRQNSGSAIGRRMSRGIVLLLIIA